MHHEGTLPVVSQIAWMAARFQDGLAGVAFVVCLAACAHAHAALRVPPLSHGSATIGAGITPAGLLVEPEDGARPLLRAIDRTNDHIFVESYLLTDRRMIRALERAAAQGVRVYVLLERHPLGMGVQPEQVADMLKAAGVFVRWSPPWFRFTHAKLLVLDDRTVVVSTANLSRSAFSRNREILLFDRARHDVHEISALFRADWDRLRWTAREPDVVVAPDNARGKIAALIGRARRQIEIYAEEIADPATEQSLAGAERRGVQVRVILAWGASPAAAASLRRQGVGVRELRAPYIHAKLVAVDGREAFVGSENLSSTSLDRDREIGLLLRGDALRRLHQVFSADWRRAVSR